MHPKREQMLEAAVDKFAQYGAESTTMQEIAQEAGVGKGTLYRYFDNKEDLISSLIETGITELIDQVQEAVADLTSPIEKLEEVIITQLEFYNSNRSFSKFLTREIWGYKDKFEQNIQKIRSNYTVIVEEIIKQGINNGDFKDVNTETAATSLIGMVNITALHWFMFKESFPVQEIKDDIINLYFEGVVKS